MRIIGLTGGIASGKSTVAELLKGMDVPVIDADQLSRQVVTPGEPAYNAIVAEFGTGILNTDRTINRTALGKIVFADPAARQRLEAITHPAIRRRAEDELLRLKQSGKPVVIYMAPLLIEAGASSRVDEIWVVYVDRETQLKRVMARDKITREEASQKVAAQMPMEVKKLHGSVVIDNRGSMEELATQVQETWNREVLQKQKT
ncbi:dephospho-CoA kinase [Geotalea sp. SG265]|uniref:dephospho-CoA kinase n=1 Tax=Geotalea sp. SG265 TaxID=2922867 RepID=UPI001FAFF6F6